MNRNCSRPRVRVRRFVLMATLLCAVVVGCTGEAEMQKQQTRSNATPAQKREGPTPPNGGADGQGRARRLDDGRARRAPALHDRRPAAALRHEVGGQRAASRPRPEGAWPNAPDGFKSRSSRAVCRTRASFAPHRTATSSSSKAARSKSACCATPTATARRRSSEVFADGLNHPFGIAFYPPGRIRNGSTSPTPTRSSASRIVAAT